MAFRLTAVATISRDARNMNPPPEEEEAGIFLKKRRGLDDVLFVVRVKSV